MYSMASCPTALPLRLSGFHWTMAASSIPLLPHVLGNAVCKFLLQPVHRHATNATNHKYRQRVTIVSSFSSSLTAKVPRLGCPVTPDSVGKTRYRAMSQSLANTVRDLRTFLRAWLPNGSSGDHFQLRLMPRRHGTPTEQESLRVAPEALFHSREAHDPAGFEPCLDSWKVVPSSPI